VIAILTFGAVIVTAILSQGTIPPVFAVYGLVLAVVVMALDYLGYDKGCAEGTDGMAKIKKRMPSDRETAPVPLLLVGHSGGAARLRV